jgi:hypothetical protein
MATNKTLDEFIEEREKDIERFKKEWLEGNKKDPDNWPMEMPDGEWDEQFRAWWDMSNDNW